MFIMPLGKDYCSAMCSQKRLPDHLKPPFVLLSFGPLAFPVNRSQWFGFTFYFPVFHLLGQVYWLCQIYGSEAVWEHLSAAGFAGPTS